MDTLFIVHNNKATLVGLINKSGDVVLPLIEEFPSPNLRMELLARIVLFTFGNISDRKNECGERLKIDHRDHDKLNNAFENIVLVPIPTITADQLMKTKRPVMAKNLRTGQQRRYQNGSQALQQCCIKRAILCAQHRNVPPLMLSRSDLLEEMMERSDEARFCCRAFFQLIPRFKDQPKSIYRRKMTSHCAICNTEQSITSFHPLRRGAFRHDGIRFCFACDSCAREKSNIASLKITSK